MGEREEKLEAMGYPIDRIAPEGKLVDAVAIVGDLLYASGQVPFDGTELASKGKVPSEVSAADATRAAVCGECAACNPPASWLARCHRPCRSDHRVRQLRSDVHRSTPDHQRRIPTRPRCLW